MTNRGGAESRVRLFENVDRLRNGLIADGVNAYGEPAPRRSHHVIAHKRGVHGGTPAIAFEMRIGVGFGEPSGMLARNAVEELLESARLHQGSAQLVAHAFETRNVARKRGEEVCAARELAAALERAIDVVPHEIEPGFGGKRHIADACDAEACKPREKSLIGAKNLLVGKRSHDARHKRHGRGFAHDAREFAFFVDVVAAAGWRHALARNSQFAQCARIQPQGMGIAGIQGDGAAGEGGVKRGFAWQHGRVPSVLAPPLRQKPAMGLALGKGSKPCDAVGFRFAQKHFGQRA